MINRGYLIFFCGGGGDTKCISLSVLKTSEFASCNVSPTGKGGTENAKTKILANPNKFGTKIFVTF